jgi:23S rRNA (guanosine2251-2'-O)-methyltransferase
MRQIRVIAHDIRSTHNVGSLLRTAEGLGVEHVYISGYTPYPRVEHDTRLPHLADKLTKQINKTALGATDTQPWSPVTDLSALLSQLKDEGFAIIALEQAAHAVQLPDFTPPDKIVILLGREVEGIDPEILKQCDTVVEIPMFGSKESFNVVQAAAMTLFHCRFA